VDRDLNVSEWRLDDDKKWYPFDGEGTRLGTEGVPKVLAFGNRWNMLIMFTIFGLLSLVFGTVGAFQGHWTAGVWGIGIALVMFAIGRRWWVAMAVTVDPERLIVGKFIRSKRVPWKTIERFSPYELGVEGTTKVGLAVDVFDGQSIHTNLIRYQNVGPISMTKAEGILPEIELLTKARDAFITGRLPAAAHESPNEDLGGG
jgi:hypothetical protein